MNDKDTLEQFKKHGMSASYHFADDSGSEWNHGNREKSLALELFDAHPDLQTAMREIAKGFLWTLSSDRPRFEEVTCSQCGGAFGPGDNGFSHCEDHRGHLHRKHGSEGTLYSPNGAVWFSTMRAAQEARRKLA